ncbi:MAG: glycerophosphoryl diester phosphodiesterase [Hyphococcus sp.]|nr:MAG: glycerophosphoryl diester phosphodiesterase [Marinicaulis sp.]
MILKGNLPYWAAGFLVAASCSESVTNTNTHNFESTAKGWSINPEGDLNAFFECLEASGVTLVSAHRGGSYPGQPENAIETMDALMADTPAVMEIDVAASSDGVLYLMHDDTLDRTTNSAGPVASRSWKIVKDLKLQDDQGRITKYSPPKFEDVLLWANGRTLLQVDIKRSVRYEDLAEIVNRHGAERNVILIAYSLAQARKLHRLMPDAMISLSVNSQSELNRVVASGVADTHLLGFTGTDAPRPRLFSILNNRDVEVIFGTLGGRDSIDQQIEQTGDEARYAEIAAQGVDIIATDRPREAYAALSKAGRSPTSGECGIAIN